MSLQYSEQLRHASLKHRASMALRDSMRRSLLQRQETNGSSGKIPVAAEGRSMVKRQESVAFGGKGPGGRSMIKRQESVANGGKGGRSMVKRQESSVQKGLSAYLQQTPFQNAVPAYRALESVGGSAGGLSILRRQIVPLDGESAETDDLLDMVCRHHSLPDPRMRPFLPDKMPPVMAATELQSEEGGASRSVKSSASVRSRFSSVHHQQASLKARLDGAQSAPPPSKTDQDLKEDHQTAGGGRFRNRLTGWVTRLGNGGPEGDKSGGNPLSSPISVQHPGDPPRLSRTSWRDILASRTGGAPPAASKLTNA